MQENPVIAVSPPGGVTFVRPSECPFPRAAVCPLELNPKVVASISG